jgi:dTDP-4-dehydrorhamnose 3,5-epimerase
LENYPVNIIEVRDLPLLGSKLVLFKRFLDNRGYFTEIYRRTDFVELAKAMGLDGLELIQANESRSLAGVIRGLHFQYDPPQGKLIRLLYGQGVDLSLDVRPNSPTYGKMIMVNMEIDLQSDMGQWIWLPPGLAHGNFYLEDSAIEYFCNSPYNPKGEVGLNPLDNNYDLSLCDPSLRQKFTDLIKRGPIISERDAKGLAWADWKRAPRSQTIG